MTRKTQFRIEGGAGELASLAGSPQVRDQNAFNVLFWNVRFIVDSS
jgi:hypothetical protein